jgi:hypothetical protein
MDLGGEAQAPEYGQLAGRRWDKRDVAELRAVWAWTGFQCALRAAHQIAALIGEPEAPESSASVAQAPATCRSDGS